MSDLEETKEFFQSALRKVSPKDLSIAIAEAVSKICGKKVDCDVIKISFDGNGKADVRLNFSNNMDY